MDDDWGYPYDSGNLHMLQCGEIRSNKNTDVPLMFFCLIC